MAKVGWYSGFLNSAAVRRCCASALAGWEEPAQSTHHQSHQYAAGEHAGAEANFKRELAEGDMPLKGSVTRQPIGPAA